MTSIQELIGNCFYISLSRSACCILPREDKIDDAYMQELNAVVLYVVIFVPSQFLLASVFLTPVHVRHTARN